MTRQRWSTVLQSVGHLSMDRSRGTLEIQSVSGLDAHGCGSVAVSTVGCGPAGPGSSPGHGPTNLF